MKKIICSVWILFIVTWFVCGVNIWLIGAGVSTALFTGRMINYIVSLKTICAIEIIAVLVTVPIQLLFHSWGIVTFSMTVLLRIIFLAIVYYDSVAYQYIVREQRREE